MGRGVEKGADAQEARPAVEVIRGWGDSGSLDWQRPLQGFEVELLLELAGCAPSLHGLQPWRFLVVESAAGREKLRRCAYGRPTVSQAAVVVIVLGYQEPDRSHLAGLAQGIVESGQMRAEEAAEWEGRARTIFSGIRDRRGWACKSAMVAAATMMISAQSLGISNELVENFDEEGLREGFGVPDDHAVCCLVALGFAGAKGATGARLSVEAVCYREHFGQPWKPECTSS